MLWIAWVAFPLVAGAQWSLLQPHFQVPERFEGDRGVQRDYMTLKNGQPVQSPADWQQRREELRAEWMQAMGEWPPLLEDQELEVVESRRMEDHWRHTVRFRWTPTQWTSGYLLTPPDAVARAAVITVYYEPETAIGEGKEERDFALQLVRRGLVALSLGTSEASAAKTYALYWPRLEEAQVQPLSMLAYAAANAWHALAKRPEVDPRRIGITGHSFGGKWALFAGCLWDRFAAVAVSDPGIAFQSDRPSINYWEPWYLGYHPPPWRARGLITAENPARGLYPQWVAAGHDLHELEALLAPRPFLVSGGAEDPPERWRTLNHLVAVNRLLGVEDRVGMTNRPDHAPNAESNAVLVAFFAHFLKQEAP